jgi:hypothetical protein
MKPRDVVELIGLAALWGASFLFMRVAAPEFGPIALAIGAPSSSSASRTR